jgi:hypothetical protein
MKPEELAAVATALLIVSEALSQSKRIKSNGWIDLLRAALRGIASDEAQKKGRRWLP